MALVVPVVAIPLVLLLALLCGHLPLLVRSSFTRQKLQSKLLLANLFAAGVFLSSSLVHLLPDAQDALQPDSDGKSGKGGGDDDEPFPLAGCLSGIGFLVTLFVEHGVRSCVTQRSRSRTSSPRDVSPAEDEEDDFECGEDRLLQHNEMAKASASLTTSLILLLALCFHSILAGLSLGLSTDSGKSAGLLFAILAHKGLASFALGTSLLSGSLPPCRQVALLVVFACATPLGIIVGLTVQHSSDDGKFSGGCTALAAGTFLYVGIYELMVHGLAEAANQKDAPPVFHRLSAIAVGFTLMSILALWT